jgi:hypothetical protein
LLAALLCFARAALASADVPDLKKLDDPAPVNLKTLNEEQDDRDEGVEVVGKDIQKFGEQVAKRVDRMIRKKGFDFLGDPWLFQGIPIVFPSASVGFNVGLKVLLQDIRRQDPHSMEVEAHLIASDKGRYKSGLGIDIPHAIDGRYRLKSSLIYDRDISFLYYGIGNNTTFDPAANPDNFLYQNVRAGPSFSFELLRYMGGHVRMGPILGLRWRNISTPAGSLLDQQQPAGIRGGRTHYVGLAIIHDTLDFEPYPSRGATHELYFYLHHKFTGSDYNFIRGTYTYRRFIPLHRRLILAHRTLFEAVSGDVPYYELGAVGGSDSTIGFGGDRFLRGYDSNRFIDKFKFVVGFELRWDPITFVFAKQDLTLGFVPFLDAGRVWSKLWPFELGVIHASMGYGVRLIWNNRFIIRGDFAVNSEGTSFVAQLGSSF